MLIPGNFAPYHDSVYIFIYQEIVTTKVMKWFLKMYEVKLWAW